MKPRSLLLVFAIGLLILLPGCDVIIGIFKAGFWTAIFLVLLVILVVGYGIMKYRRSK